MLNIIIFLIILIFSYGCGLNKPEQIILITLDTTRADHLSCCGSKTVKTPFLESFGKDAMIFKNCYSTSNSTLPSHTSIFTSLYMKDHGVEDNRSEVFDDPGLLARVLKEAGYKTAGFTSAAHLSSVTRIDQGFEEFYPSINNERKAEDTNAIVFNWLEKNKNKKFFVWIHYFDPHMPYAPPDPFSSIYRQQSDEKMDPNLLNRDKLIGYGKYIDFDKDPEYYRNLYKGEISYLDSQLGKLFKKLKESGIYENSQVIIIADHGESLGEDRIYFDHMGLGNKVIKVPLIIKLKGSTETGEVKQLVSNVDVYPTILDLAEVPKKGQIRGRSLLGISRRSEGSFRQEVFFQSKGQTEAGVSNGMFTLIKNTASGKALLYKETAAGGREAIKNKNMSLILEKKIDRFMAEKSRGKARKIGDKEFLDKLKSLGYLH